MLAMVKTSTPGVFKRGSRYVVVYRDPSGRQRKEAVRTLAEARTVKGKRTADVKLGDYRELSRRTFAEYAPQWIASYHGRTSTGIRENTLERYRQQLGIDDDGQPTGEGAIRFFGRMQLAAIEPRDVKRYAAELTDAGLSGGSVKNHLAPVRALLADAFEEGLIRSNPSAGVRITRPAQLVNDDNPEHVKALTEDDLRALLDATPEGWRLFFEFLAHTGLRISEAIALRWGDIDLGQRRLRVRRRIYKGKLDVPKSKYGRRAIPLSEGLARQLWTLRGSAADEELVFSSKRGKLLNVDNVRHRVLKPAGVTAGVWLELDRKGETTSGVGFHTFRHTCATTLFRKGLNAKQVQLWMGHHSAAFTLATYVHLLPDDLPDASFLDAVTGGNKVATRPAEIDRNEVGVGEPETAQPSAAAM